MSSLIFLKLSVSWLKAASAAIILKLTSEMWYKASILKKFLSSAHYRKWGGGKREVRGVSDVICQRREGQDKKLKITLELQSKPKIRQIFPWQIPSTLTVSFLYGFLVECVLYYIIILAQQNFSEPLSWCRHIARSGNTENKVDLVPALMQKC